MKETAWFYKTKAWQDCRDGIWKARGGICEECWKKGLIKPAEIVHHKTHLNIENIHDPDVTLNWDNLELVCRDCHGLLHGGRRYKVDAYGNVCAR